MEDTMIKGEPLKLPKKELYKRLLVLAIPIALQNFLSALLNIVDSAMVQSLGEVQMGAVLLVNQFIFVYQVIIFAIAGAGVVFISQFYGKGDIKHISTSFAMSSMFVIVVSVIFTIISLLFPEGLLRLFFKPTDAIAVEGAKFLKTVAWSFLPFGFATLMGISLRGIRRVIMPLIVSAGVILVNFFFNYTFMFGKFGFPSLGIVGAAVGTDIARVVEMVAITVFVLLRKYPLFGRLKTMFAFTKDYFKKYIKLFIPACANEIFWVLGTTIYLFVFSQLDGSETILAAVNITQAVDKLVFVALIGLGNAAGVVVGNELGAGNEAHAIQLGKHSLNFSTIVGIIMGGVTMLISLLVPFIYTDISTESIKHAQYLLIIFGAFMVVRARTFTLIVGVLRAGGDTVFCMLVESVTIWVLAVPIALLTGLVLNFPIELIYICIYAEELIKMLIVCHRFKTNKWMKNLVQNI